MKARFLSRGITLIEMFVALAVVAILLSAASSSLERMSARVDVDIARENILLALRTAQRSAVRANIPVRLELAADGGSRLIAGFSSRRRQVEFYAPPNYILPEHITISLSGELDVIEYLPTGQARNDGVITIASGDNPDYVVDIDVGADLEGDAEFILQVPASP
jgi:prepilin-type N-terminal cleavage/methylation domain-containing protein